MLFSATILTALAAFSSVAAGETVLGVYIIHRHGDRTPKSLPPSNLTDLGYSQVFTSGTYFRSKYIASGATNRIYGINSDLVKQSQISASAPVDTVLQNSAMAFLQAIYPPVGENLGSETLGNGSVVQTPLNGYQLIPLQTVQTGAGSEDAAWLQGSTNCANAQISSNNYFSSAEYMALLNSTQSFYNGIVPMVNRTFTASQTNFKNGYVLYDLLNVASIHNSSANFPNKALLTPETFFQLRTLADQHEWGLAYNASEPIRAVTGAILGNEVVNALNNTITSQGKTKLNIQFGAYAGMFSLFGLSNLTAANPDFYGIPDYASSLTWELVTNATVSSGSFPSADQISVRFLFHNGTTSNASVPIEYPLFGQSKSPLPWTEFASSMSKFTIKDQVSWCQACGNTTGTCSPQYLGLDASNTTASSTSSSSNSGGMSNAVAGVIGAMVTLAVILGAELLIVLVGGFRLISKKKLAATSGTSSPSGGVKA